MDKQEYKYICKKCNFKCRFKSLWDKHIITEKHKTGHRKKRCDIKEPYKCEHCNYETKNRTTFKKHVLNEHSDKNKRKKEFRYYCDTCDFGTFSKDSFTIHQNTKKHKRYKNI